MLGSERMEVVQEPIIGVIGSLVRSTPGTISLGQGISFYGPPREAMDKVAAFGNEMADHRYGPVDGSPALRGAINAQVGFGQRSVAGRSRDCCDGGREYGIRERGADHCGPR